MNRSDPLKGLIEHGTDLFLCRDCGWTDLILCMDGKNMEQTWPSRGIVVRQMSTMDQNAKGLFMKRFKHLLEHRDASIQTSFNPSQEKVLDTLQTILWSTVLCAIWSNRLSRFNGQWKQTNRQTFRHALIFYKRIYNVWK